MKKIAAVLLVAAPLLASAAEVGGTIDGGAYDAAGVQARTGVASLSGVKQIKYTVTISEKGKVPLEFAGILPADGREHPSSSWSEHPYVSPCANVLECKAGDSVTRRVDTGLFVSVTPGLGNDGSIIFGLKLTDSELVGMDAVEEHGTSGQSPWVAGESMTRTVSLVSGKPVSMPFGKSGRTVTVRASVI
ncbi:hypothetical protein [Paraburkholderia sp. Ac-20347]|uniref:hypothetical protein n=1 Tax=Paraburkholderia sp. Ac-20347 TaxID=2703892 RepID=UPI001980A223|nr:hypothetical protein [Paraburkholderia sp. Ac-20347]MBN3814087.1 hypothetical protein [Paraburkholderia sp. Ac-20347]